MTNLNNIPNPNRINEIVISYNGFGQSSHSAQTVETIIIAIASTIVLTAWAIILYLYLENKKK